MILCDKMGHMISDTSKDELHNFAQNMGLKRSWFQEKGDFSHYDLTTSGAIARAVRLGAKMVNSKEIIYALRKLKGEPLEARKGINFRLHENVKGIT